MALDEDKAMARIIGVAVAAVNHLGQGSSISVIKSEAEKIADFILEFILEDNDE